MKMKLHTRTGMTMLGPNDTSRCGRCRSRQQDSTLSKAKCDTCGMVFFGCIYCMTAPSLLSQHKRHARPCNGQPMPGEFPRVTPGVTDAE
jgi:hypothetical protein